MFRLPMFFPPYDRKDNLQHTRAWQKGNDSNSTGETLKDMKLCSESEPVI